MEKITKICFSIPLKQAEPKYKPGQFDRVINFSCPYHDLYATTINS